MRPVLASRNSPWRARRLSGWLVGLAVSLAACNGKPARKAPRVNRLARETWAATHLEVSRRELLPRTVVARPDALVWRVSAGQFAADPSGAVRFAGPGVAETVAAVTLSPAVAYSLRARGEGGLAVESRSALGNRQSVWEEATKQRGPAGVEFEQELSLGADRVDIRIRAAGPGTLHHLWIGERPVRSKLQITNARDAALRGFVRRPAGELEHILDSLLATGRSEYEWPLASVPYPRMFTVEIASVERHGEDREPPAPVAMMVDFHADGEWHEAMRRVRGGPQDAAGWLHLRMEVKNADGVRLRTEPTAAGRAATVAWGMPTVRPAERGNAPDVFIFTLDALRADHLGTYGSTLGLTPTLDRIAGQSAVFDQARTARGNTWESLAGIAYGTFPETVGVGRQGDLPHRDVHNLPQVFGEAGYLTARLGWSLMPPGILGSIDVEEDAEQGHVGDKSVMTRLHSLLEHQRDVPLFVWVHFTSTHYPYAPDTEFLPPEVPRGIVDQTFAKPVDDAFAQVVKERGPPEAIRNYQALYQASVRQTDAYLGQILADLLRPDRPGGPPIVAFLADHGAHMGEGGLWFVHATLAGCVLRIPLIIYAPGRISPGRISPLVRSIDLGATLLDYAGLPSGGFAGQTLRPLIEGRREGGRTNIVRKLPYETYAIENDRFKLIVNPLGQKFFWPQFRGLTVDWPLVELFEWHRDPGETQNLEAQEPLAVGELWRQLGSSRMTVERPITPEVRNLLIQAGYLPVETTAP
jgi:arylsulfatase A-like enzyme